MKPAWDRLADEYAKSDEVVIADVDCTAAGQSLCQQVGVRGYPTIKYYIAGQQKDYQGGRDFDSLKRHVTSNMGPPPPPCTLEDVDGTCNKREKRFIEKHQGNSDSIAEELEKLKAK
eukprot:UN26513